jgi:lysophospholipase L1-like esterase
MLMCNLGTSLSVARAKVRAINHALGLPRVIPSAGLGVPGSRAVESSAVRLLYRASDTSYYVRWTSDVASVAGLTRIVTRRDGTTETTTTPASDTGDVASTTVLGFVDQGADYMQRIAGTVRKKLIGDSWTQGTGDPAWVGYRRGVSRYLSDRNINSLQVGLTRCGDFIEAHSGFGGLQVAAMQSAIENRWWLATNRQPDAEPHVCVLFGGLNDVLTSADDAAAIAKAVNVGTCITALRSLFPGTWIVHVQIPTYTGTPGNATNTARIGLYNAAVQTVLDSHAAHTDGVLVRANLSSTLTIPGDLSDAVPHASVSGYAKIAAALGPSVLAAIGTRA